MSRAQVARARARSHAARVSAQRLAAGDGAFDPQPGDAIEMRGTISRVFHASPGWSAAAVAPTAIQGVAPASLPISVSAAGAYFAREREHITIRGTWKRDPKWGMQVVVDSASYELPANAAALAEYLAGNPAFRGIGPSRAAKLAERWPSGDALAAALAAEPEEAARVSGATIDTIRSVAAEWASRKATNAAATFLAGYGLTSGQQAALLERYGSTVVAVLTADPYQLLGQIPRYGFKRLDAIARKLGVPKGLPSRLRHGVLQVVRDEADEGHTWIERDALLAASVRLLELDAYEDATSTLPGVVDELVARGALVSERWPHIDATRIALPALHAAESRIAAVLREARRPSPAFSLPGAEPMTAARAAGLIETHGRELNARQRDAVAATLLHGFAVVTGPAGSGKSYMLAALLSIADAEDISVALAAPTGKAAQRMTEATGGRAASTLHRLLGYQGRDFALDRWLADNGRSAAWLAGEEAAGRWTRRHHGDAPWIDGDLLVLDEMSMTCVELFAALLRVVDRSRTALLLIGDHNQLPPVGPGAPLRDMLAASDRVPTVVLTEVVRQAGTLKANSTAILDGRVAPTEKGASGAWFVMSQRGKDAVTAAAQVVELVTKDIPERLGFDAIADVQVLAPMHKGPAGVQALNAALQSALQRKVYGVEVPAPASAALSEAGPAVPGERATTRAVRAFYAGDKVIHCRNDYSVEVMNGTQGRVRWVGKLDGRKACVVDLEGRYILYTSDGERVAPEHVEAAVPAGIASLVAPAKCGTLADLQLAYALTIHRVQGSQFPCVVALVHKVHSIMHSRNLFYTAATRAQRALLIVGDSWGIANCAKETRANARRTWIPLLLGEARA